MIINDQFWVGLSIGLVFGGVIIAGIVLLTLPKRSRIAKLEADVRKLAEMVTEILKGEMPRKKK